MDDIFKCWFKENKYYLYEICPEMCSSNIFRYLDCGNEEPTIVRRADGTVVLWKYTEKGRKFVDVYFHNKIVGDFTKLVEKVEDSIIYADKYPLYLKNGQWFLAGYDVKKTQGNISLGSRVIENSFGNSNKNLWLFYILDTTIFKSCNAKEYGVSKPLNIQRNNKTKELKERLLVLDVAERKDQYLIVGEKSGLIKDNSIEDRKLVFPKEKMVFRWTGEDCYHFRVN